MVLHKLKKFAGAAIATTMSAGMLNVAVVQSVSAIPSTHSSSDQRISEAEPNPSTRVSAEVMEGEVVSVVSGYWVRIRLKNGDFVAVPLEKGIGELDLNQGATIYVRMSGDEAVAMASSESAFSQVASASSEDSLMQRVREARVQLEQRQTVQQQVIQERTIRPAPAPAPVAQPQPQPAPIPALW